MVAFNRVDIFSQHLAEKFHDLNADTLKVYLSNAVPSASLDLLKADLAEIAGGNGYTAGGADVLNATSRTGQVTSVTAVDVTWTATGAVGPFQYVPIYNDTSVTPLDPLLGWWDYGSPITLANGESFTVDFGASILTIG